MTAAVGRRLVAEFTGASVWRRRHGLPGRRGHRPGKRYEDWDLPDPAGLDLAAVRPIRDEIGKKVRRLLAEPTGAQG